MKAIKGRGFHRFHRRHRHGEMCDGHTPVTKEAWFAPSFSVCQPCQDQRLCLTVRRRGGNWLHVGGDGGLKTASILLSVCACATRHHLKTWAYLRDALDHLAAKPADVTHLLPDVWAKQHFPPPQIAQPITPTGANRTQTLLLPNLPPPRYS